MARPIGEAQRVTEELRKHADTAMDCLRPQVNAFGVLAAPQEYLQALRAAKEEIEMAIARHKGIRWPTPEDYDAA